MPNIQETVRKAREQQQTTGGTFVSGDAQPGRIREQKPEEPKPEPTTQPDDDK